MFGCRSRAADLHIHGFRVEDIKASLAAARQAVVFGFPLAIAARQNISPFQRFDHPAQAIPMRRLDQPRLVEQVQGVATILQLSFF